MTKDGREPEFQRNDSLEDLLMEVNALLAEPERQVLRRFDRPKFPLVLVVGPPRSGTTLLMQWLASTGAFAYPTNLLSRFYDAPYIGARIQQLLTDPRFQYGEELYDLKPSRTDLRSNTGKTKGALEPSEFWYFWRRFIPNEDPEWITDKQEDQIDGVGFLQEIASLESVFGKPFVMKGMILQFNIAALFRHLGRILILHIRRDPLFNAQSLLETRQRYFGNKKLWYSVKPRQYPELEKLDPYRQVAGQIYYTNQSIQCEIDALPDHSSLTIEYEDLCSNPEGVYRRIHSRLAAQGYEISAEYSAAHSLPDNNTPRLDDDEWNRVVEATNEL